MDVYEDMFELFTSGLRLPVAIEENAKQILAEISSFAKNATEIQSKTWLACALYVAVQNVKVDSNRKNKSHVDVTVSQLLYRAEINIMDFFCAMCYLKSNYTLSCTTQQNFIALERKYCIVSALYDKFEKMVNDIFSVESSIQGYHLQDLLNHYKSLCWTLFLVVKAKALWHRQELLATFHLLLCCIAEVIKAAPTFLLLPPFDNIVITTTDTLTILDVLSNVMGTTFEEVKVVYDCWLHVAEEVMPDSALLELAELKAKYTDLYLQSGDLDESKFLERDWHIIPKGADINSPKKIQPPSFSSTLEASQALSVILQSAPNGISNSLLDVFKLFSRSPISIITNVISNFRNKFTKAFVQVNENSDNVLAERRYDSASKYYYLMLDAIVRKEAARLSLNELTIFLHNQIFHQSLLACCTEVVHMCCGSVASTAFTPPVEQENNISSQELTFPWVLKVFEIKAYHFFKIIDTFIKTSPAITQQIISHLKSIENKILQSLAWISDSPVFSLSDSSSKDICFKNVLPVENSPKTETVSLSPGVNIFFNKVSRFAYRRVEMLCNLLKLEDDLQKDIWICMEHIIYSKSYILKNRCLDQLIMCCVYAVCKVKDHEILFKLIISKYNQLPGASESVYRQVLGNNKKEYIIAFYNSVFAPEMKQFVTNQFSNDNSVSLLSKAALSPLSPSYSIFGRRNIFVSPLKKSPFKNPNEIIIQTSSSQDLSDQKPQRSSPKVRVEENKLVLKRLRFDDDDSDIEDQNSETCKLSSVKKFLKFED